MKSILVTGGAGFIGSHTCVTLLEKGYELYVIDSYVNSYPTSLKRVIELVSKKDKSLSRNLNVFEGDLRDSNLLQSIFDKSRENGNPIDSVIHFAGIKSVAQSILDPISYWDSNLIGTICLINTMNQNNCHEIVFSSSATIYGNTDREKITEDALIKPVNPYGITKMSIEKFLRNVYDSCQEKWKIANLRYFNPIGAHSSSLIGEYPKGEPNNIFPYINNVASGDLLSLSIFGNDWPTADGTGVRDYIHVMDLAEGHIRSLEFLKNNKPQFLNLNMGTGKGTSVLELIKTFEEVNKVRIPFTFGERRSGDVAKLIADNSLLKLILNWEPKRTLEEMCKDGWKWQSQNPLGYK